MWKIWQMFLKTLAKSVKFTIEKKFCVFLVEKPTKVVENKINASDFHHLLPHRKIERKKNPYLKSQLKFKKKHFPSDPINLSAKKSSMVPRKFLKNFRKIWCLFMMDGLKNNYGKWNNFNQESLWVN
jgi:hypothetical protein